MGFQQCIIIGNVGRDPEFKYTPQGVAVCSFSVAVNRVTGRGEDRKEKTIWFRVTAWRERAETVNQYVKKGMKIMVIGDVDATAYISKQTNQPVAQIELTARDFQFLDSRAEAGVSESGRTAADGDYTDDASDLPF